MSVEQDLEKEWIRLNEHETTWRTKRDALEQRDFDRRPWTNEDQNAVLDIVRFMSGAIERIEMRQAVLYRISHANLTTTRDYWRAVLIGALAFAAFSVYEKLVN